VRPAGRAVATTIDWPFVAGGEAAPYASLIDRQRRFPVLASKAVTRPDSLAVT
jgi:hypothetical protein